MKVCSQFVGDALRATFVTNVLFSTGSLGRYGGVPDNTRANAFRHSYAVARFTRTMLTKFKNDGPVTWGYRFARAHELEDRQSDDIRVRRSSFMDTNNNLVGYNYTTDHPTRNGAQLCSTMRTKSKHARYARYPTDQDEVPVPPDAERTRLIYNRPYDPEVTGTGNPTDPGFFPQFKPCKYALARYDAGTKVANNRCTNRTAFLLVVIIGIGLSSCQGGDTASDCKDSQFNSARWKPQASWSGRPSVRQRMADDLVRCKTLMGRTGDEIVALLGRPEHPARRDEDGPCYELGPQRDLGGLDNEVMCLTFGPDQKVKRVDIVTF